MYRTVVISYPAWQYGTRYRLVPSFGQVIRYRFDLSYLVQTSLVLYWPALTHPDLSWPILTYPDLSRPILTCPSFLLLLDISVLFQISNIFQVSLIFEFSKIYHFNCLMFPKYLSHITYSNFLRGGVTKKKPGKFGKNSQLGLTPPPPRIIQNFWNFRTFWKLPPPPLGSNSELFEFQTFLIKVLLQNNWNSDIFEKLRPPP